MEAVQLLYFANCLVSWTHFNRQIQVHCPTLEFQVHQEHVLLHDLEKVLQFSVAKGLV